MKKCIGFIFFITVIIAIPGLTVCASDKHIIGEIAQGQSSRVGVFDVDGNLSDIVGNYGFSGGIEFASGDVDGDNINELVVVARYGLPNVRIYSKDGKLKYE